MASAKEVAQALQSMGFEQMGTVTVGAWRGYAVSFTTVNYGQLQFEFAVRLDKKDREPIKASVQALKDAGMRATAVHKGSAIDFMTSFNKKTPLEQQIWLFLDTAAAALAGSGAYPAATCYICGGGAPESLCLTNSWQPVHAGCVRQNTVKTRETADENLQNGSYLLGLLGAVIGAIIGTIPNILSILFLDRVFAILFALIPLAAMWGYRKLGGKRDAVSIIIVIILSILSVLFITTFVASYETAQEYRAPFFEVFFTIAAYVFTAEGFLLLLQDSIISFVFIALGIVIAWRFLNQTGEGGVKLAEAAETTIRPNPAYMAQAPAPANVPSETGGA